MTVVQINAVYPVGSTGRICEAVSRRLTEKGITNHILYADGPTSSDPLALRYMSRAEIKAAALSSRIRGNYGFEASAATRRMIRTLEGLRPDVVHLHNLHGHNADLGLLLGYLASRRVRTFWTFHDCWMLTGSCPHFEGVGCDRWQTGCGSCPLARRMSWFCDNTAALFARKRALLAALDLTVVCPSAWMAGVVRAALPDLPEERVVVVRNGIDLDTFRPTPSDFRAAHGLADKRILLAAASAWTREKGVDTLRSLSLRLHSLPDADAYRLVVIGTLPKRFSFPSDVLTIPHTDSQASLAGVYSAADVLINPTREDTYPTVDLEAVACGTPVVTFASGGAPETVPMGCGAVVPRSDEDALLSEAVRIASLPGPEAAALSARCAQAARPAFAREACFDGYLKLYQTE